MGALLPGLNTRLTIWVVTVQWFTAKEQTLTATTWQAMLGVSSAVGNLLAYGFYHIKGKDPLIGWQWLTVCIALISFVATGEFGCLVTPRPSSPSAEGATDHLQPSCTSFCPIRPFRRDGRPTTKNQSMSNEFEPTIKGSSRKYGGTTKPGKRRKIPCPTW